MRVTMPATAPGMASPMVILFAVVSPSLPVLLLVVVPPPLLLIDTPLSPTVMVEVGLETTTSRFLIGFSSVVGAGETRATRPSSLISKYK